MFYVIFGYNRWYRIIGFKRGRVESGCELMIDEIRTGGAGMVEKEEFYLNSTYGVN